MQIVLLFAGKEVVSYMWWYRGIAREFCHGEMRSPLIPLLYINIYIFFSFSES